MGLVVGLICVILIVVGFSICSVLHENLNDLRRQVNALNSQTTEILAHLGIKKEEPIPHNQRKEFGLTPKNPKKEWGR